MNFSIHELKENMERQHLELLSEIQKLKQLIQPHQPEPRSHFITTAEVTTRLGVSKRTVQNWRDQGILRFYKPRRVVRYIWDEVVEDLTKYGYLGLEGPSASSLNEGSNEG